MKESSWYVVLHFWPKQCSDALFTGDLSSHTPVTKKDTMINNDIHAGASHLKGTLSNNHCSPLSASRKDGQDNSRINKMQAQGPNKRQMKGLGERNLKGRKRGIVFGSTEHCVVQSVSSAPATTCFSLSWACAVKSSSRREERSFWHHRF